MEKEDFSATDSRGFKVECTKENFEYIRFIKHPESSKYLTPAHIRAAIENPRDGIYSSNWKPSNHIYYSKVRKVPAEIKVVVDFSKESIGKIITFHLSSKRPDNEKLIWPDISH